jgi:pimeloyl-ACP methyl ester carboxylesterase
MANHRGDIETLTLTDGTQLRYLQAGAGPALVLLHTVRTQLDYFYRAIPLLTAQYTVYALDFPGMGWSPIRPGVSYDEPALRRAVVGAIRHLDLDDVTLAGESLGAVVALTASTELAGAVRRVVAFNTYDYPEGVERANWVAKVVVSCIRAPVLGPAFAMLENAAILRAIVRGGFFDASRLPNEFITELRRSGRRRGYAQVSRAVARNLPSLIAARDLYAQVSAPVTLVYGDHDWSHPAEREATAALLPHAHTVTLRDTGHFSALERPDQFADVILGQGSL